MIIFTATWLADSGWGKPSQEKTSDVDDSLRFFTKNLPISRTQPSFVDHDADSID